MDGLGQGGDYDPSQMMESGMTKQVMMALALMLGVAACSDVVEFTETGQCEPGVEGLSQIGDITPAGC
jgi:hypothetical protein